MVCCCMNLQGQFYLFCIQTTRDSLHTKRDRMPLSTDRKQKLQENRPDLIATIRLDEVVWAYVVQKDVFRKNIIDDIKVSYCIFYLCIMGWSQCKYLHTKIRITMLLNRKFSRHLTFCDVSKMSGMGPECLEMLKFYIASRPV